MARGWRHLECDDELWADRQALAIGPANSRAGLHSAFAISPTSRLAAPALAASTGEPCQPAARPGDGKAQWQRVPGLLRSPGERQTGVPQACDAAGNPSGRHPNGHQEAIQGGDGGRERYAPADPLAIMAAGQVAGVPKTISPPLPAPEVEGMLRSGRPHGRTIRTHGVEGRMRQTHADPVAL